MMRILLVTQKMGIEFKNVFFQIFLKQTQQGMLLVDISELRHSVLYFLKLNDKYIRR